MLEKVRRRPLLCKVGVIYKEEVDKRNEEEKKD